MEGLEAGTYRYVYQKHSLEPLQAGERRVDLAQAALGQQMVAQAPLSIVVAAIFERAARRYGKRGVSYTFIDVLLSIVPG
ncbi:MAG TPA: hypothetical protein VLH18_05115 [Candidatus Limnocylindrales bacterium]|nr:hypothetical protein [Candidatus Limnocylindrales bacterium]